MSVYRREVGELVVWSKANNLCINVEKTKEMVVDFRMVHTLLPSSLDFIGYLGLHFSSNREQTVNAASIVKKAHQRWDFMRRLKQAGLSAAVLTSFYRCVVASILTSSITVWNES